MVELEYSDLYDAYGDTETEIDEKILDASLASKIKELMSRDFTEVSRKEASPVLTELAVYVKTHHQHDVIIPAACASSVYSASEKFNISRANHYLTEIKDLWAMDYEKYQFRIFLLDICAQLLRLVDYSKEV